MNSKLTKILPMVSKPTRYVGDELNAVRKNPETPGQVRFALAFPDIYDVGMSHLGLKILYYILNSRDDVWAERVYAPWTDMEEKMRVEGIALFSLESGSPLEDFDIVGFSLQYEMSYTNVLNMLDLARIPLLAEDRNNTHPLIIAGGPCAFNPEPMADFIDFFVIGDGEEVVTEIVDCYKSYRDKDRKELLGKMADIEGVYVPMLVSVEEQPDGMLTVADSLKVRKRVIGDLNSAPYPVDYLLPFMRPIHDRAVIEVMRGCSRGCRFCQAGMIYRPVRERSVDAVETLAGEIIGKTGYEELSLSSLSTCDHSSIHEMVKQLLGTLGTEKHVSISMPSLRMDAFSLDLAQKLGSQGKSGLTFAPEVATQRMQKVVNKNITGDEMFSTVESAFSAGWDSLKLYFMIGLPTETEEDVAEIACLAREILKRALKINRRASFNVSVATFIPKTHTPFQWEHQLSLEEIEQRQNILRDRIGRDRRLNLSFHSPQVSYLEGVFARGDRRLGKVLQAAHELGCRLDGWTEHFNFHAWMQAFAQCGIDPEVYHGARKPDQIMPWDHIDTYVTKDFLLAERNRAYESEITPDCRQGECSGCGVCSEEAGRTFRLASENIQDSVSSIEHPETSIKHPVSKIRFQFAKREQVKFISHLDLLNSFTRAFRRAGIPIAYSHGFNPHPRISFGSVLPVGTTSEAEFADIELEACMEVEDFIRRCREHFLPGLEILRAQEIPMESRSLMAQISLASYTVQVPETVVDPDSKIHSIMDREHVWIERSQRAKKKSKKHTKRRSEASSFVDIKPLMRSIRLLKHTDKTLELEMLLGDGQAGKVRPEEIVRLILDGTNENTEPENILSSIEIRKTGSFIEKQGQFLSPMEILE